MSQKDLYTLVAAEILGVAYEKVTQEQRHTVKKVILRVLHQETEPKLQIAFRDDLPEVVEV